MILFTLRCARGHQFEGWFRDGDGFEAQQKTGAISCPECGETKVEKAVMAPRLGKPLRRFRRLALGLGVAEDPWWRGLSFGPHRCRIGAAAWMSIVTGR